jgi:YVTN family beta-propeller protein
VGVRGSKRALFGAHRGASIAATVGTVVLLVAGLAPPASAAGHKAPASAVSARHAGTAAPRTAVANTAPTPPDLFVAYAPQPSSNPIPGADTAEAFNTSTLASLGATSVGATPVAEAVSPDGGTAYVLNQASDSITPIDTLASPPASEATISLPSGYDPIAFAISPDGADAYVAASLDTDAGSSVLWEITIGGDSPGTLARTIALPSGASPAGVALTPNGKEALVTDYADGTVIPVTLSTGKVGTPIGVGITPGSGSYPLGIQVSPDGSDAYVADSLDGSLAQITLATGHVTAVPLETGYQPQQLAVSPDGSTVWVTEDNGTSPADAGFAVPVSVPSLTVGSPVGVGLAPNGVAFSPDGTTVYVANETDSAGGSNSNEGSVSVIPTSGNGSVQTIDTAIDPAEVVVTPDEAPVASFSVTAAPAGGYTTFDASASYSLTSGGLTYSWNFGDGSAVTTTTSAVTRHIYPLPGAYTVTLNVTDASGTSTRVVYTGQYVLNNGGALAGQTATVSIPGATVNKPPVAYVTDSQSNQVTPILADPLEAAAPNDAGAPITVGSHPDAVAITPNGRTAYVVNFGSDNVTPIDTATDTAGATPIAVGSEPDAVAITPDGTTAYVANSGDGTVSKIALSTGQVQATIRVGGSPSGLAISPDGTTAYVTDNNPGYENLIPITLASGAVQPGIPAGTDPVAVAITPDGHTAYVVDRGSNVSPGAVTPVDLTVSPPAALSAIPVGTDPDAIAVSPAGDYAYVTNYGDGTVSQIPVGTGSASTLPAGSDPAGIAVLPSGSGVYVADDQSATAGTAGSVSELSVPAAAASPTAIAVGTGPDAVAITPDQAPDASLSVVVAPATEASSFDASQSTFPSSPAASYTWNFGDGTSPVITTTPTTTHTYAVGGTFTASVTITDNDGTSTTQSFTGQTVSLNGNSSAEATQTVSIPYLAPTITSVSPASGQAGAATSLIIGGTDLFGLTSVHVGAASVTGFTVNAAGTEISNVLAPAAGPGSVDVTATNATATSAITPADVFTYLPTTTPPTGAPTVTALSVGQGPVAGGTGVTITGTDLSPATAVSFGGLPAASFTVNSAGTQITAVSPAAASAGTVDVTVTTPVATSAVSTADVFTYVAPAAAPSLPSVTSVSPNSGPTSGLTSVTVTGINLTGVTAVDFGTAPAQSFHSVSATSLTAVSPAVPGAETVDITVTTLSGTTAVVAGDAFTFESGVTSAGPVITGVAPAQGPVAGGTTVVITGSNLTGIAPTGVVFGSAPAQFSVNSAGTQLTATSPAVAQPGTVDIVATNSLGSSVVTPADAFTYLPDATFIPTVTGVSPSSGPQAGGTSVTLTGTGLAGATKVSFGSTDVTSFTESGNGDSIDVDAPAANAPGTVSVTVTGPAGTSPVTASDAYTYLPANPPITGPQVTAVTPPTGPAAGGTGVTISGTGFSGATSVDFGGLPASSFTVDASGTSISAVSPAASAAGSVDVTVTVASATSPVVTADVFTYLSNGSPSSPPAPAIASLSPATGPVSGGTQVTVTGSGFTGATAVDFGATAATHLTVQSDDTITVDTPAASYAGPQAVTVTTPSGTSAAGPDAVFTYLDGPSVYHPVAPVRILDTRNPGKGGPMGPGTTRTLKVAGVGGVPTTADAVVVNLTVTDATTATSVTLAPAGDTGAPNSLVAARDDTVAHLEDIPVGAGGAISITNAAGSSQVVIDLEGYDTAGTGAAGRLVSLAPATAFTTAVKSGTIRSFKLAGVAGVPEAGVAAVVFQLRATATTAASYATVYPAGEKLPVTSNLNWQKGNPATNLVVAPLGTGGAVNVFNHYGNATLTAVVTGYITTSGATKGSLITPVAPTVLLDTSASGGGGPIGAGAVRPLHLAGLHGIPAGATGVVIDVTTTSTTAASSLTVYPAGAKRPTAVNLTWAAGHNTSNLVYVPLGTGGAIDLYNLHGTAGIVVTLQGTFTS